MATSRSPPSTCSTTSPTPRRTGTTCRQRRSAPTVRCSYYPDRAGNRLTANQCTWKDLRNNPPSTSARHRPAWRRHRGQPAAAGGQGGRRHQHHGCRRDEPRRGREPGQDRLRRPRCPPHAGLVAAAQRRLGGQPRRRDDRRRPALGLRRDRPRPRRSRPSPSRTRSATPSSTTRAGQRPVGRSQILVELPGDRATHASRWPRRSRPRGGTRDDALHRHRQPLQVQERARRPLQHRGTATTPTPATVPASSTATGSGRRRAGRVRQRSSPRTSGIPAGLHDR